MVSNIVRIALPRVPFLTVYRFHIRDLAIPTPIRADVIHIVWRSLVYHQTGGHHTFTFIVYSGCLPGYVFTIFMIWLAANCGNKNIITIFMIWLATNCANKNIINLRRSAPIRRATLIDSMGEN